MSNFEQNLKIAAETVGDRFDAVLGGSSDMVDLGGGVQGVRTTQHLDTIPSFSWEERLGFTDKAVEGVAKNVLGAMGFVIALIAFYKEADGTIKMPPSIQAAMAKNRGNGEKAIGENGFLYPDTLVHFGYYDVKDVGMTVALPETHVMPFSQDVSRSPVLLSISPDNNSNKEWEKELQVSVAEISRGLPSGPFVVLVKGEVCLIHNNGDRKVFGKTLQLSRYVMSGKCLVADTSNRKPMQGQASISLLMQQLGNAGSNKPVAQTPAVVEAPKPVQAATPTDKTEEAPVRVNKLRLGQPQPQPTASAPTTAEELKARNTASKGLI